MLCFFFMKRWSGPRWRPQASLFVMVCVLIMSVLMIVFVCTTGLAKWRKIHAFPMRVLLLHRIVYSYRVISIRHWFVLSVIFLRTDPEPITLRDIHLLLMIWRKVSVAIVIHRKMSKRLIYPMLLSWSVKNSKHTAYVYVYSTRRFIRLENSILADEHSFHSQLFWRISHTQSSPSVNGTDDIGVHNVGNPN